jgi:hypothetical protein
MWVLMLKSLESFPGDFTPWRDSIEPGNEVVNLILSDARRGDSKRKSRPGV